MSYVSCPRPEDRWTAQRDCPHAQEECLGDRLDRCLLRKLNSVITIPYIWTLTSLYNKLPTATTKSHPADQLTIFETRIGRKAGSGVNQCVVTWSAQVKTR